MCLDFKLKFGITHNWKFYYITIRPAVLVWNTTTPLKTACESIQVQAVPWSTHHHTFVMSEFVSLLSSIHTIAPPCMLNWWVRCCAWTATNCHLLDPAVIAEGRAHSLARKNTKFAEFFYTDFLRGNILFPTYRPKLTSRGGWMQLAPMLTLSDVSRRGWHTCAEAEQTPLMYLPYTYANAERYQQHTSPFFDCSCHLRLQP